MLRTGQKLNQTPTAVNAITNAANQIGGPGRSRGAGAAIALTASTMVSQFSQAKLPDSTSHSWVTITTAPATPATGCGANSANGTTNCAKWLPATSDRKSTRLNSSHPSISYAVFCLKKKKQ